MAESVLPSRRPAGSPAARALRVILPPCALLAALIFATLVGPVNIPVGEVLQILLYKLGLYRAHASWSPGDETIIWQIRLPRVLGAALVGAALAVAGALFQAILRNPLADPYVIGTAAGAQLGVTVALSISLPVDLLGFGSIQLLAFAGALGTVLFVYSLARTAGRVPVVTLLLAGFVMSSFLISATTFLMMAGNRENTAMSWIFGSMDVSEARQLVLTGPLIGVAAFAGWLLAPRLDVLLLGEEQAAHLGVRVERLKLGAIVLASLLTALAVSLAGIVAFVGLVVPHAVRLVYGPRHRVLIPTAACAGATFVIAADALAHAVLAPTVIPLGIVTAVAGAPLFLHLLRRSRREYAI